MTTLKPPAPPTAGRAAEPQGSIRDQGGSKGHAMERPCDASVAESQALLGGAADDQLETGGFHAVDREWRTIGAVDDPKRPRA
ncbi:hypothetical protein ATCC90586_007851 [Pythium insidiosum]|nr:hypothetical protein ATCC90586_007851 [Pythium insidiosum]